MKNKAFLAYGMMLAALSLPAAISFDAPGHVYVEGAKPVARGGVPGATCALTDWRGRPVDMPGGLWSVSTLVFK